MIMPHSDSEDSTGEEANDDLVGDLAPPQEIPTQSQSRSGRIWKLENAEMRILGN